MLGAFSHRVSEGLIWMAIVGLCYKGSSGEENFVLDEAMLCMHR